MGRALPRDDDDPPSPVAAAGSVAATREVPDATAAMSNAPDDAFRVRPRDVDHPRDVENVEAFVDALDDGGIVGDATVNKSGALAASVTRAAVDTLEDALAAVEARAEAKERKTRRRRSSRRRTTPAKTKMVVGRPTRALMQPPRS